MAGKTRNRAHVVEWLHRLEAEPHRFGFLAAIRMLETFSDDKPRLGESARAADDSVRFGQSASLAFAPTSIAKFKTGTATTPDRMQSYFFGLFGPNGPMPLHISEYVYGRELNEGDRTFRCFADIFHHRLTSLFYRACVNGEPTVNMDRPEHNNFDLYVGSLLGIGPNAYRHRDAMPDNAKLHNAARLSLKTRPAEGLQALLENYFELPFQISEFVGEWLSVAEEDRLHLGRSQSACILGATTIVGAEIWSCQHKFRIVCGSLELSDFMRLLPGAKSEAALVALVRNYLGDEFSWDLQLILKKDEVPATVLGSSGQLGWTSWLGNRKEAIDAGDVIIDLQSSVSSKKPH